MRGLSTEVEKWAKASDVEVSVWEVRRKQKMWKEHRRLAAKTKSMDGKGLSLEENIKRIESQGKRLR